MKRYWLANSSETPPSPPSSTVGGYPQDGNIALNHKPTKVGAWWYHMITEEFMAVIERAGLTPSHENLHQLADIFDDFKQRAQGAETFKDQAVAAANRAEAAADQVVTDVAGAIEQVQAATDAEIARLNTRAGEVETSTSTGLTNLQNKLTELIANLEQVGGEQAAYVISQAQEILDEIIPPQSGQAGKFLSTNGTSTEWKALDALPSQTGNSGKFLSTDGTTASWEAITDLNNKADKDFGNVTKPYVVEEWHQGSNWYRVWSTGFIEQGGIVTLSSKVGSMTINLNTAMTNTNYVALFCVDNMTGSSAYTAQLGVGNKTTTSFKAGSVLSDGSSSSALNRSWYVCGY